MNRLSIDPQAMVIEESDKEAEAELRERIASTASEAASATAHGQFEWDLVRKRRCLTPRSTSP